MRTVDNPCRTIKIVRAFTLVMPLALLCSAAAWAQEGGGSHVSGGARGALVLFIAQVPSIRSVGVLHVSVQGETNLVPMFVETFRREAREAGFDVQVVERSRTDRDYSIILAQESTMGSAAAAVIALDRDGNVAASVVRSGRLSGHGAINACTKELAKQLAILRK